MPQAKPKAKPEIDGVDFATLSTREKSERGVWFTPTHPETGKPLKCRIRLAGQDSSHYLDALDKLRKMRADLYADGAIEELTPRLLKEGEAFLVTEISLEWEGFYTNGKPHPWDKRDEVYEEHDWLVKQCLKFARKRGNFTPG